MVRLCVALHRMAPDHLSHSTGILTVVAPLLHFGCSSFAAALQQRCLPYARAHKRRNKRMRAHAQSHARTHASMSAHTRTHTHT